MRRATLARAALLVLSLFLAYLPALRSGFIWDDDVYLTKNHLITAADGMRRIWLTTEAPSQYFPLVYSSFRLEHALWGYTPAGYHVVNVLLHAGNALLLWRILALLGVPGAGLGAAFFALHPLQVESVAWITERKNVLSLFFSLVSIACWLRYLDQGNRGRWRPYLAALASHLLALFAKTTAVTMPLVMLLVSWMRGRHVDRARLRQTAPFFAASLALGLLGLWWEQHHQGTSGRLFALSLPERALIAGRAFWFYLASLAWPVKLTFIYPRWTIDAAAPLQYLWPAAAAAAVAAVWVGRDRFGRGVAAAGMFYVIAVAPLLGFIPLYTHRYSFVADHHAYVAAIGPLAALAAVLTRFVGSHPARRTLRAAMPACLLMACGALTWKQTQIYRDAETLWRDTLAKSPRSGIASANLGLIAMREGRLDEAFALFRRALSNDPTLYEVHGNLGILYTRIGRPAAALDEYHAALRINPDDAGIRINLGGLLQQLGRLEEAAGEFRAALNASPGNALAHGNLGTLLLARGAPDEALPHLEEAVRLRPDFADAHYSLGRLHAARGMREAARGHFLLAFRGLPAEQAAAAMREVEPLLR